MFFLFNSYRREFRRSKPTLVLAVGSSDGANQPQFSSSEVPTVQTNFSSLYREFRQRKPTLVLLVGSSDGANQLQFSSSGVPTGQTNSSSLRRKFRQNKFFLLFLIRYSDGKKWYSFFSALYNDTTILHCLSFFITLTNLIFFMIPAIILIKKMSST